MARSLGAFVLRVAMRLLYRGETPPAGKRRAKRLEWGALGASLATGILFLAIGNTYTAAPFFLSVCFLFGVVVVRRLTPMLAVSTLGIVVGVAALFTVLSVASGFEQALLHSLGRINGHLMVSKYGLDFHEYRELGKSLEANEAVRAASPFVWGAAALVRNEVGESEEEEAEEEVGAGPAIVVVKGMDPTWAADFEGIEGCFRGGALQGLRPADPGVLAGAVLGYRLAERKGIEIGDIVRLVAPQAIHGAGEEQLLGSVPRSAEFRVTDLADTGVLEYDRSLVLVHLTAAQSLLYAEDRVLGIELQLRDPSDASVLEESLAARLNATHRLPLYRVNNWARRSEIVRVIHLVKTVIALILSLIILVATSSLIGGLLVLIRRKRPELAVLRTMGARSSQIFWIFETIALVVGGLGGGGGVALGTLLVGVLSVARLPLDPAVYPVERLPVSFAFENAVIPAFIAMIACLLIAGPVAVMASKVRPLEALRH